MPRHPTTWNACCGCVRGRSSPTSARTRSPSPFGSGAGAAGAAAGVAPGERLQPQASAERQRGGGAQAGAGGRVGAQAVRFARGVPELVEPRHEGPGGQVVHLPEAHEHLARARAEEGPGKPQDPLALVDLAERRLAGAEHDQIGPVQLKAVDFAHG